MPHPHFNFRGWSPKKAPRDTILQVGLLIGDPVHNTPDDKTLQELADACCEHGALLKLVSTNPSPIPNPDPTLTLTLTPTPTPAPTPNPTPNPPLTPPPTPNQVLSENTHTVPLPPLKVVEAWCPPVSQQIGEPGADGQPPLEAKRIAPRCSCPTSEEAGVARQATCRGAEPKLSVPPPPTFAAELAR